MKELLLITLLVLFIYVTHKKNYRNPLGVFVYLWSVVFFLYEFRYLPLYDIEPSTYMMYFIGISSVAVGYLISSVLTKKTPATDTASSINIVSTSTHLKHDGVNRLIFLTLCGLSIASFGLRAYKAITYWISGGIGELKSAIIMDQALSISLFWDIVFTYIARPMQYVVAIYFIELLLTKTRDKIVKLVAFCIIILYFVASGSKFSLAEYVIFMFAYFLYFPPEKNTQLSSIYKKGMRFALFMIIIIIGAMTLSSDNDVLGSLYCYLCGCLPHSDQALEKFTLLPPFLGGVSFNGFLTLIKTPLAIVGVLDNLQQYGAYCFETMNMLEETSYIGDGIRYNAFVSMFTYFYIDGGYPGVFILSLIFGILCHRTFYYGKRRTSFKSVGMLLLFTYLIISSLIRSPFFLVTNVLSIFYAYFFLPKYPIYTIK